MTNSNLENETKKVENHKIPLIRLNSIFNDIKSEIKRDDSDLNISDFSDIKGKIRTIKNRRFLYAEGTGTIVIGEPYSFNLTDPQRRKGRVDILLEVGSIAFSPTTFSIKDSVSLYDSDWGSMEIKAGGQKTYFFQHGGINRWGVSTAITGDISKEGYKRYAIATFSNEDFDEGNGYGMLSVTSIENIKKRLEKKLKGKTVRWEAFGK